MPSKTQITDTGSADRLVGPTRTLSPREKIQHCDSITASTSLPPTATQYYLHTHLHSCVSHRYRLVKHVRGPPSGSDTTSSGAPSDLANPVRPYFYAHSPSTTCLAYNIRNKFPHRSSFPIRSLTGAPSSVMGARRVTTVFTAVAVATLSSAHPNNRFYVVGTGVPGPAGARGRGRPLQPQYRSLLVSPGCMVRETRDRGLRQPLPLPPPPTPHTPHLPCREKVIQRPLSTQSPPPHTCTVAHTYPSLNHRPPALPPNHLV